MDFDSGEKNTYSNLFESWTLECYIVDGYYIPICFTELSLYLVMSSLLLSGEQKYLLRLDMDKIIITKQKSNIILNIFICQLDF